MGRVRQGGVHLSTAEINEVFRELVRTKIELLSEARSTQGATPVTAQEWEWLDEFVLKKLQSAIQVHRNGDQNSVEYVTLDQIINWYDQVYSAVLGISALGAGFTFTVIFSDIADSPTGRSKDYVRTCIIASWMLFVLSIGAATFAAMFLSVNKSSFNRMFEKGKRWYKYLLGWMTISLILPQQLLPIAAFLASTEAVRAYHPVLGALMLALVGAFGVGITAFWIFQKSKHLSRFIPVLAQAPAGSGLKRV